MCSTYVPGMQAHIHRDKTRLRPPEQITKKKHPPSPHGDFQTQTMRSPPLPEAKIMRHKRKEGEFLIRRWADYHPVLRRPIEGD